MSALPSSHAGLAALAAQLPRRTIEHEAGPYLSRYTLADLPGGGHVYLHFFHRSDIDSELHSHPWAGRSIILAGGYMEERRKPSRVGGYYVDRHMLVTGDENVLDPDTFHRVDLLDPKRGCWTLFTTGPKVDSWGFWDRATGAFTPWREAITRRRLTDETQGTVPR